MLRPTRTGVPGITILRRRLLAWYDRNQRDLPWRRSADPYRIWLSEIMLQQTRVAAVLGHYRVFLARFPTVRKLAAAPLESVLAAWSGLGYYSRARSLHHAAQLIVESPWQPFSANGAGTPRPARGGTLYRRSRGQHCLRRAGRSCRWQCRARDLRLLAAPTPGLLGDCRIAAGASSSGRLEPGNDGARRHHLPAAAAPMRRVSAEAVVPKVAKTEGAVRKR